MRRPLLALCMTVTTTCGCHFLGSVRLTEVASASGKPSNVATMVSVTAHGQPLPDLGVAAFKLSENGQPLDSESVDLRLLDPTTITAFHTVLALDLGHGTSDERRRQLSQAAAAFVRRVRQRQAVTVLSFDGSPHTRIVGEFSIEPSGSGPEQLDNLLQMAPIDPSRDLNGAVISGLDTLDARLERSSRPVHLGTLVVFSRGPDVAGRVSSADYDARIYRTPHHLVYVTVAGDPANEYTAVLATRGRIESQSVETLPIAFEDAAPLTHRLAAQYYLLSYCSPARAGERTLRVEVQASTADGKLETDAFETQFDATGFSPSCNSGTPPRFSQLQRPMSERAQGPGSAATAVGPPKSPISPNAGTPDPAFSPAGVADPAPAETHPPAREPEVEIEVPPPKRRGYAQ